MYDYNCCLKKHKKNIRTDQKQLRQGFSNDLMPRILKKADYKRENTTAQILDFSIAVVYVCWFQTSINQLFTFLNKEN